MKNIKKIDFKQYENEEEDLVLQPYFKTLNLIDSRTIFKRNSFTLNTVRENFKGNKQYRKEKYMCVNCLALDPPLEHPDNQGSLLRSCPGNLDLQQGEMMRSLEGEARFYRKVDERRVQLFGG